MTSGNTQLASRCSSCPWFSQESLAYYKSERIEHMARAGKKVSFIRYLINFHCSMQILTSLQHFLSLPVFLFLVRDVQQGLHSLSDSAKGTSATASWLILGLNLCSQLVCVSGVNRLSSVRFLSIFKPPKYIDPGFIASNSRCPRFLRTSFSLYARPLASVSVYGGSETSGTSSWALAPAWYFVAVCCLLSVDRRPLTRARKNDQVGL
jgi:hypothetical protein